MHGHKTLSVIVMAAFLFAAISLNVHLTEVQAQPPRKPLTNYDIISLAKAGVSDAAIVSTIQKSPTQFDLAPEDLVNLRKSGVSNTVIETMIQRTGPSLTESTVPPPPIEEGAPPSEVPGPPPGAPPPPPPPIAASEPELVVLPGTYVYFAPGIVGADIFFYNGFWYRSYRGYWYRSLAYNGVWLSITPPSIFFTLPPDYRARVHLFPHIKYHDFYRNWGGWQRDKYWNRHEQWISNENWYREHQRRVGPPPGSRRPPSATPPPRTGHSGPGPSKIGPPGYPGPGPSKTGPPGYPGPGPSKIGPPGPPGYGPSQLAPPKGGEPAPVSKGEDRK